MTTGDRWRLSYHLAAGPLLALLLALSLGCSKGPNGPSGPSPATPTTAPGMTNAGTPAWPHPRTKDRQKERDAMVETIRAYELDDKTVLEAIGTVPRHEFVPSEHSDLAYVDSPLPIGHGQTISQPYIVAEMTRHLNLSARSKVLEIGTGSGYQAAVLTEFTPTVFSIEIVKPLADRASETLKRLGYKTVKVKHADGYSGWPEEAPFDGIIVTCAAGQIPPPLLEQLKPGGRMVIPVGAPFSIQSLMLLTKDEKGAVRSRSLMPVRFVPLAREETGGK